MPDPAEPSEREPTSGEILADALRRALTETDQAKREGAIRTFGRIFDGAIAELRAEIPQTIDELI